MNETIPKKFELRKVEIIWSDAFSCPEKHVLQVALEEHQLFEARDIGYVLAEDEKMIHIASAVWLPYTKQTIVGYCHVIPKGCIQKIVELDEKVQTE